MRAVRCTVGRLRGRLRACAGAGAGHGGDGGLVRGPSRRGLFPGERRGGTAGSPPAGVGACHNRFWALAEEDEGDDAEVERYLRAVPDGPSIRDIVAFAATEREAGSRRGRRFVPGGRGFRAMASRIWQLSLSVRAGSGAGAASGAARLIRSKATTCLLEDRPAQSREDYPRLSAPPASAAEASCGREERRSSSGPRVGPMGRSRLIGLGHLRVRGWPRVGDLGRLACLDRFLACRWGRVRRLAWTRGPLRLLGPWWLGPTHDRPRAINGCGGAAWIPI